MGISFYIGDEQVDLTNAYFFNSFLNWVAEQGEYPQILDHSPVQGSYLPDDGAPPGMYSGSVQRLQGEVERLLKRNPPDYAEYVLKQMLKGTRLALKEGRKITMDDGAWDGDE